MIEKINQSENIQLNSNDHFKGVGAWKQNSFDRSIFTDNMNNDENISANKAELLEKELQEIEDAQGVFSNAFNDIKELTKLGTSSAKCDEVIEKYKNGEISFDEALNKIEKFETKQGNGLNLFSNIVTSFAAIGAVALAVGTGGIASPLTIAAIGAGAGAVTKAGVKLVDRATNKVDGDAANAKTLAKDALSGAVTGGIAAATMGTGCAKATLKESIINGAKSSGKTGLITGTVSGASNYVIDCSFDDKKDFEFGEFAENTLMNAAVCGTVGAIVGGTNGALRYNGLITHGGKAVVDGQAANISARDVLDNGLCSSAHKVLNDRIKSIAA